MPAPRLPRTVKLLGWVSLFTDISSEMVYPVIPLFLTMTLKAPVLALGLIEGAAEAIVSVMKGLSGWHSDKIGRRVGYIRWGYGLAAAAKPILALAHHWPLVLFARSLDRFGKGVRTSARDAMIADLTPKAQTGAAYGFHRAMDTAGALVGVLLSALLLVLMPGQYRWIFVLALIPAAIAVALTFSVKETPRVLPANPSRPAASTPFPRGYWLTLGLFLLFTLANSSDTFLLLRTRQTGLTDAQTLFVYALYNVTYTVSSYPAGALSDRVGRWKLIGLGWVIYAFVYFGFAYATSANVWALFAVYGLHMGLTQGVGKALVADYAPKERLATALGLFHMTTGFSALAASAFAGYLWDAYGPRAPFLFGAGTAALAVIALPLVRRLAK